MLKTPSRCWRRPWRPCAGDTPRGESRSGAAPDKPPQTRLISAKGNWRHREHEHNHFVQSWRRSPATERRAQPLTASRLLGQPAGRSEYRKQRGKGPVLSPPKRRKRSGPPPPPKKKKRSAQKLRKPHSF